MPNLVNAFGDVLAPNRIIVCFLAHLEELIPLLFVCRVPEAMEVIARHGIDHVTPDLDADIRVLVENRFVELVKMDPCKTVIEGANVGKTACQAHTATIYLISHWLYVGKDVLTKDYIDALHQRLRESSPL